MGRKPLPTSERKQRIHVMLHPSVRAQARAICATSGERSFARLVARLVAEEATRAGVAVHTLPRGSGGASGVIVGA